MNRTEHSPAAPKRLRQTSEQERRQFTGTVLFRLAVGVFAAALLLINLFTHVLTIVQYGGQDMSPALESGQSLVLLNTQKVEQGDLIAFYYNNKVLVRRVICEGGHSLSVERDGTVYIDSKPLDEPYLRERSLGQCNQSFPIYVQPGYLFVMGDDRTISIDSRLTEIGTIPLDRVIGKVILKL